MQLEAIAEYEELLRFFDTLNKINGFSIDQNQMKSNQMVGDVLRNPGDDLTKPDYQWDFQPDKFHSRREKKKSDTSPNLSNVTSQRSSPNTRRQTQSTEVLLKEKV